jgi:2,4-dienoyl-CoA reductase-like NADH-dependent reductase (Old Yellow Enzyme family)
VFTQFLSSAINDRDDEYGGSLENRARFLLDTVRAIRDRVGDEFHLQVKLSATEYGNALMPWAKKGNTIRDSVEVARWVEQAGADAIHVSSGNTFPHPDNPGGVFSAKDVVATYDVMLSSGIHTFRNYLLFRTWPFSRILERRAGRSPAEIEGANLSDAAAIKRAVSIPVLCTGGFQRGSTIAEAIRRGDCDAVTIARALIATPDLVRHFEAGRDEPPRPCTYCNKCLYAVLESPLGCYDERRYPSREAMLEEILSVFHDEPVPAP